MFKTTETNVTTFNSAQFGELRTHQTENGNVLFCLNDVMKSLGLTHITELRKRLQEKGCSSIAVLTNGGNQQMVFIDEPNLYRCIFQSRKTEAEQFQNWVFEDVLPSIRKTGGYIATTQEDTPELIMARALQVAQTTISKHQQMLEQANERIVLQSEQLKQQAPKVKSYDEYISSEGTFSATQIAKEYGWGAKTLNNKLRELGVQYKQHGQWLLFAKYSGKGYTKSVPHAFTHADGRVDVRMSTVWTAKGREYIHSLLKAGQPGMLNFKDGGNK